MNNRLDLFPQYGALPSKPSVNSFKAPSCSYSARASLTSNDSASASISHCGSGGGGVSPIGQVLPRQSGGLIPQDGYIPFNLYVRSPKPPSCLESTIASLTDKNSASASTSHHGSGGVGVSTIRQQVRERKGVLITQYCSIHFEPYMRYPNPPS